MQGPNVLLADDSLTIQKVIALTLEGLNLSLSICKTKAGLAAHLAENEYDILLIDYGMAENTSGVDFVKELMQQHPRIKILPLLGTLDADDQSLLAEIGIEQTVVKPFDGNTLVAAIEALWGNSITDTNQLGEAIQASGLPIMSSPQESDDDITWEQEVPGVINSDHDEPMTGDIPSVIKADEVQRQMVPAGPEAEEDTDEPARFPEGQDLAYPDQDELRESVSEEMTSKLVSLDDLDPLGSTTDDEPELDLKEDTSPGVNLSDLNESRVQEIEEQIEEEIKPDLWQPDQQSLRSTMPSLSKSEVRLIAQEVVEDYMKESLKRALKEIVPEIAEKIITREIEKISERILRDEF